MVMIINVIKIVILIVIVTVIATTELNSVSRTLCHPERVQVNNWLIPFVVVVLVIGVFFFFR